MKKLIISITVILIFSLTLAGAAFAKEQTICPLMGGKINKEIYADHDGKRVYFCCTMCIDTFKKDPAKYIEKMEKEGISLTSVPAPKKTEAGHEGHNHD
jgi:YHS domain-containing protein